MSANSVKGLVAPISSRVLFRGSKELGAPTDALPVLDMLRLNDWRRQLFEAAILLGAIHLVRSCLGPNAAGEALPHPYWIPVLLASVQYGLTGGIIAAAVASVLCFIELSAPSATQDFYAYAKLAAVQPAMWFGSALLLGGIRNLHLQQATDLSNQLEASRSRADDLAVALEHAVKEMTELQRRTALDTTSAAATLKALSDIDLSSRRTAVETFGPVFRAATGISSFIFYLRIGASYMPMWGIEADTVVSTKTLGALSTNAVEAMIEARDRPFGRDQGAGKLQHSYAIGFGHPDASHPISAVIVCRLDSAERSTPLQHRIANAIRVFQAILNASPDGDLELAE